MVGIVEVLPAAPSASAEMGALCGHPFVGELLYDHNAAFGIVFLFLDDFHVHNVAGYDKGDEENHAVDACNGFTLSTNVGDGYVFQNGLFF